MQNKGLSIDLAWLGLVQDSQLHVVNDMIRMHRVLGCLHVCCLVA
jgi:hypothetical protein